MKPAPTVFAGDLLDQAMTQGRLPRRERALATELVYGVLRQRNYLDWVLGQFSARPLAKISPPLLQTLRVGAYQILFLDRVPPSAAVHEAVELAKRLKSISIPPTPGGGSSISLSPPSLRGRVRVGGSPGFVNAVLRALIRGKETIRLPDTSDDPVGAAAIRTSHPEWLIRRWANRFGMDRTVALCRSNNELPPMTLRVNTLLLTRDDYLRRLKDHGVAAAPCRYAPDGVNVVGRNAVPDLPGYREGWFYVQDEGAQLISLALGPKPGETILDACAAPGGKATHLAALMEDRGTIVAVDQDPRRLSRIEDNQKRLHLHSIRPRLGNLESDPGFTVTDRFDRILVDAPCSALGVLRRHPEGRWRKGPELIEHYVLVQSRILDHVAPYLKPGGFMLYSTCSTEREENEDRIAAFLSTHPEFESVDLRDLLPESARHLVDDGYLHTTFSDERMDGFFAAGMKKR